jgi:hypothetical protein
MAIRFPGTSGNFFSRASDLPAVSPFTASWWVKLAASVVNRNNPFTIYADSSNYIYFQTRGDNGSLFQIQFAGNGSNVLDVVDVGVGNWYFMALTVSGTAINVYYAAESAASLSVVSTSASSASWWTPAHMRLSQRPDTFGRINGTLASVKIWSAALTQDQLEIERLLYRPVYTDNLHMWTPIVDLGADRIKDYGGSARDWTSNGASLVDEDGPPLMWGSSSLLLGRAVEAPPPVVVPLQGFAAAYRVLVDRAKLYHPNVDRADGYSVSVDHARRF